MNNNIFKLGIFLISLFFLSTTVNAITVPANIFHYIAINIINNQNGGFSANADIRLTINAISYNAYFTNNMQNFEFFYGNGTIIPSWLEGNVLNEFQAANLITSANVVYWVRINGSNNLFPKLSSNIIYGGWTGNVPSPVNDLFSNTLTGANPMLFCSTFCPASSYGQYDTGANVFPFYSAFGGLAGGNLPANWGKSGAVAPTVTNFGNFINFNSAGPTGTANTLTRAPIFSAPPFAFDWFGSLTGTVGPIACVGPLSGTSLCSGSYTITEAFAGPVTGTVLELGQASPSTNTLTVTNNAIFSGLAANTISGNFLYNYNTQFLSLNQTNSGITSFGMVSGNSGEAINIFWARGRVFPPNGIMASATFGPVNSVSGTTLNIASSTLYLGQNTLITVTGPGSDNLAVEVTTSQGNKYIVANGFGGSVTYNFGTPFNSIIGTYVISGNDLTTGDPSSGNLVVLAPILIRNASQNPQFLVPNTMLPTCTNNFAGGLCTGNIIYTSNIVLNNNVYNVGNISINGGVYVTTNGFAIITSGMYSQTGNILSGYVFNKGFGTSTVNRNGLSIPNSCGGSGGGGGGGGGNGGNTLVLGGASGIDGSNGLSASCGSVTNANILTYFSGGFSNYLSGAQGGWGSGGGGNTNGTEGGYGQYIQANIIAITGIINTSSQPTVSSTAGTGGGGTLLIAYGGNYLPGTYSVNAFPSQQSTHTGAGGNGNVIVYHYTTPPVNLPVYPAYYPIQVYTNNNFITYTLNQTFNGVTTNIQSGNTISYIPPANQLPGLYIFGVSQTQGSNTIHFNFSMNVNMTDIIGGLTFNTLCSPIKYFPNCAVFPFGANVFTARPTSWEIISDVPGNQHMNFTGGQSNLDQWSNANLIFMPSFVLNYVWTSFSPNQLNNPNVFNEIVQNSGCTPSFYLASNVIPSAPCTRQILNFTVKNQQTFNSMSASTNLAIISTFNNYSISNQSSFSANFMNIFMPQSTYQNPNVLLGSLASSSTATGFFPAVNNYCPVSENSISFKTLVPYLVNFSIGSSYTIDLQSNVNGQNNGDLLQAVTGVSSAFSTAVQQLSISSTQLSMPLIVANPYSFRVLSPQCGLIFNTSPSTLPAPPGPIFINIPINTLVPVVKLTNATALCTFNYIPGNHFSAINCTGNDPTGLINKWEIFVYNTTSLVGFTLINTTNISGTFFTYNRGNLNNKSVYSVKILAVQGDPSSVTPFSWIFGGFFSPFAFGNGAKAFLTILFLLVAMGMGKLSENIGGLDSRHGLSVTMFIVAFMLFICWAIGLATFIPLYIITPFVLALLIFGILNIKNESSPFFGG